ncbi:TetR/AcrR family transcriptional regulator [Sporomusa acidovorans]|uniref:HTH-type transcriptional regulator YttP n=1 Tax=Sporomusa acidovorans (strain ATCC 49682 / DSM 3132 / Mol) TaxID=1123286 RepID=A0ABZ3J523_SPOA4|nr:TetR family transcriptional regulator [Sporomusa acidovorans]OZC18285.1 putative HTH-type transcriptional regulator YttP [Sporomusa acidovorans DSM 3132]SDF26568.1 transcriptional regulator, TetR family [Sporomusa acidovorans]
MKRNTANKILDTATSLFAELGFENVTINLLAQTANVNSAAISYYFGSKETLYQMILDNQFSPALQALREVEASFNLTATEHLLDYVEVIAAVRRKQSYLASLWHYEINRHDAVQKSFVVKVVKEYIVQLYQYIFSALCHGISQKEFLSTVDPYCTASVLLEMMHAPYIPASLLTEQTLSVQDKRKDYTVQATYHYLQGIRRIPL